MWDLLGTNGVNPPPQIVIYQYATAVRLFPEPTEPHNTFPFARFSKASN